jgi:hypothetical protein
MRFQKRRVTMGGRGNLIMLALSSPLRLQFFAIGASRVSVISTRPSSAQQGTHDMVQNETPRFISWSMSHPECIEQYKRLKTWFRLLMCGRDAAEAVES